MAQTISDEELQLKKRARRRLVGAVALVLLVIVFLPMLLDNEPKPLSQDVAISIPALPPAERSPTLAAVPPKAAQNGSAQGAPGNASSAGARPSVSASPATSEPPAALETPRGRPEGSGSSRSKPEASAKQPTASKPVAGVAENGYVVQLGAFSNPATARELAAKLKENRYRAYTETVNTGSGSLTRVRVGPFPTKETAEKVRDRLKARKLVLGGASVVHASD